MFVVCVYALCVCEYIRVCDPPRPHQHLSTNWIVSHAAVDSLMNSRQNQFFKAILMMNTKCKVWPKGPRQRALKRGGQDREMGG